MSVPTDTTPSDAEVAEAAATETPDTGLPPITGERVRARDPLYWEVVEWLNDEATLLDEGRTMEWVGLTDADLVYRMPVRQTRLRDDAVNQFSSGMYHYDENQITLQVKVLRLATTASPWAENPVSRTRRFITNVRVFRTDNPDELSIVSSLLITRSRYTEEKPLVMSAERRDLLRRSGDSFKLARRTILADQSSVGFPNLAVFL